MNLGSQIRECEAAGADWIHCDVMDGHFVPNLTFGPPVIRQLKSITSLALDVHLMIETPERSLEQYHAAGASAITVHQEVSPHLHRTLTHIRSLGVRAGVAINPSTPVELLEPVIGDIDILLIMTVNPGFGGQKFIQSTLKKIETASDWRVKRGAAFDLSVDGGIDSNTASKVVAAGANVLVAGTSVFSGTIKSNIAGLRKSAQC